MCPRTLKLVYKGKKMYVENAKDFQEIILGTNGVKAGFKHLLKIKQYTQYYDDTKLYIPHVKERIPLDYEYLQICTDRSHD